MHYEGFTCDKCGQEFEGKAPLRFRHDFGYASERDGQSIDINFCSECCDISDDLTNYILKQCKVLTEE